MRWTLSGCFGRQAFPITKIVRGKQASGAMHAPILTARHHGRQYARAQAQKHHQVGACKVVHVCANKYGRGAAACIALAYSKHRGKSLCRICGSLGERKYHTICCDERYDSTSVVMSMQ